MHFTAERGNYYKQLSAAEEMAKNAKRNIWKNFVEKKETEEVSNITWDDGVSLLENTTILARPTLRGQQFANT